LFGCVSIIRQFCTVKGTGIAIITPFLANGEPDYKALSNLTEFWISGGVEYLVVCGTTGESVTLNAEEKQNVLRTVVETANNRLPIVFGCGGNDTVKVLNELKTTDLSGVHSILSVAPYYNKPGQDGMFLHFMAVAEASPLPVILYNVPGRTGQNLSTSTILKLAHSHSNFLGIKEASGNMDQIMELLAAKPSNFHVISGDDSLTLPLMACGASGVISVIANAFPSEFSSMVRAALNNDYGKAKKIHSDLFPLHNLLFKENNPGGIKAVMKFMNLCDVHVRLPLTPISTSLVTEIHECIRKISQKAS
jgi:4-hydroxy-tetrahydrodipicolinate synthase